MSNAFTPGFVHYLGHYLHSLFNSLTFTHNLVFIFISRFLREQYLDNENPNQPIYLYINCPGGSVISGLAIYDTIQHIRSEVVTVNLGLAASMASFLLCAGSRGRRFALPHSRIMIHQPMGGAQGQAEDIRVEASQIMRIRNNLVKMYSLMTGQTTEQIVLDLDRWVHRVPLTQFYYYAEQYYG